MEDKRNDIEPNFSEPTEKSEDIEISVEKDIQEKEETPVPDSLQTVEEPVGPEMFVEEGVSEQEEAAQAHTQSEKEDEAHSVLERLTAMEEELKRSNQLFEHKILYDSTKEQMITSLHKELQGYKDDLHKKILKPIITDLIAFADNMNALVSRYEEIPEPEEVLDTYQRLRSEFLKIGEHVEDVIYNYGVEPFSSEAGSDFDSRIQQSKKVSVVENEEDNKKIITSLSPGYYWEDKLLRKEYVHVGLKENRNN